MQNHFLRAALTLGICSLGAFAAPALSQSNSGYTIIDLGSLVGHRSAPPGILGDVDDSAGYAINASGQVTGHTNLLDMLTQFQAFRYSGGVMTDISPMARGFSTGYAINASGQITGYEQIYAGFSRATRWTGTVAELLGSLPGADPHGDSVGTGINDSGQIAGYAPFDGIELFHAVRWTGTVPEDLGTLGGDTSFAYSINASGQVAGSANTLLNDVAGNPAYHAVRWTGTNIEDLAPLETTDSIGYAINNSGQIAGYDDDSFNPPNHYAVRWTENPSPTPGQPRFIPTRLWKGVAYGINNSGTVVGSHPLTNGYTHAFAAFGNTAIDLNGFLPFGSSWELTDAYGINDNGWITGAGRVILSDSKGFYTSSHAYILKPNSPPVSGTLTFTGISASAGPQNITFIFRPNDGSAPVTQTVSVPANGAFSLGGFPGKAGVLHIKPDHALAVNVPVDLSQGSVTNIGATFEACDANNDNRCDVLDFGELVNAYGTDSSVPNSGYDPNVDFNQDGRVDVIDFGVLVNNYGTQGDP